MYSKLGRKITNEEFDIKIKDSGFIRISDYINSKTTILFKCKICGKIFKKKPKEFNRLSCKCTKHKNIYLSLLKDKNIELLDDYVNARTKVNHKCLKCGLIFLTTPKSIQSSKIGCPSCSGKKFTMEKYKSLLPNDIVVESEIYEGCLKKLKHRCLKCGNIWNTKPNHIIHLGCGCPKCAFSKGEKEIANILNDLNIENITQYTVNIENINYRFDFYIPKFNLYIEYDGIQHFKSVEYFGGEKAYDKILKNDSLKNEWIEKNGDILRISYLDKDIKFTLSEYLYIHYGIKEIQTI